MAFLFEDCTNICKDDGTSIIINNCVMTFSLGVEKIDLAKLAWTCYGEFDPVNFAAAKLRITGATPLRDNER